MNIPDKNHNRLLAPTEANLMGEDDFIKSRILTVRGVQVMLSNDLSLLK